jgi:hypothetical protein
MTGEELLAAIAASNVRQEMLTLIEEFGDERYNEGHDDGYSEGYYN